MHAGGVHGMHLPDAGDLVGDGLARHLVDELSEGRVLLRRPAHHREGPDGVPPRIDLVHPHEREGVLQAVVSEMVAEGSLGLVFTGVHLAGDDEVGVGADDMAVAPAVSEPAAAEESGEGHLAESLRQRHDGRHGMGGRTSHEDADLQGLPLRVGLGLVHPDAAVQLVMKARLPVGQVLVAAELDAVHAEVGAQYAGPFGVFGVHLREGHEGPAVLRPVDDLRQLGEAHLLEEGGLSDRVAEGQGLCGCPGGPEVAEGGAQGRHRVVLEADDLPDLLQPVPEEEPAPLQRAEEVGGGTEAASLDPFEEQRRAACGMHAQVDGGHLQPGVDLLTDANKLSHSLQVEQGFLQGTVCHSAKVGPQGGQSPCMWSAGNEYLSGS